MSSRFALSGYALAVCALTAPSFAEVIVDDATDLTWIDFNGSATTEVGATLEIVTSKNSSSTAALPTAISIPTTGDYLTVTFDVTFDNVPTNTTSGFEVGFSDSSASGYFYKVSINPLSASNGVTLSQTGDANLGKVNSTGFGTTAKTVSFTVTKVASADVYELTAASGVIAGSPFTAGLDAPTGASTSLDTVFFEFRGDAWNQKFSGNSIKATISNFSVETNVPEPASLTLTLLGGTLCLLRRRRI